MATRQYTLNGKLVTSSVDDDDQSSNPWSAHGALFAGIAYDLGSAPPLAPAELYPHDEAPPPLPPAAQTPVENGSGDATAAVAASGNQDIDGILSGVRWADGFITYSDPNSTADYGGGYPSPASLNGFSQVSAQQMVAVHFGLNSAIFTQPIGAAGFGVEGFTNLTIDYAGSGSGAGTIRVANSSDPGTAYAFYPHPSAVGGDAFFGPSGDFPDAGDYDWHTVLHELGHSLGLKHGHETDVFGALPSDVDSLEFSIMTYRTYIGQPISGYSYEAFGAPQTFMMLDIAALQYMYGADFTTNSGNTVYTWSQTDGTTFVNGNVAIDPGGNRIFATIWDGGGIDTYDLSNYTTDLEINLAPGQWSTFSDTQLANLGGGPNGGFARGNIANALLFQGNTASLIENAIGGSGDDTIQGNDANNTLTGNAGDDILKGVGGADTLNGGSGSDSLKGGGGADTLNGGDGNDTLNGDDDADTVNGGNGDDRVIDADFVNFDVHDGGAGIDTIDYSSISFASGFVTIDLATGQTSVSGGNTEQITNFENVEGSDGGETIIGNSLANVLNGNDGNDVIDGGFGGDVIDGGVGNDTINGGSGSDVLNGGDGNDTLFGGFFTDTVNGGNGDDTITVLDGEFIDNVDGGAGTDTLDLSNISNDGPVVIDTTAGTWDETPTFGGPATIVNMERIIGTQLGDTITGSNTGVASNSIIYLDGQGGDDLLVGDGGGDTLLGGAGNDTLRGGFDVDNVFGGDGDDTIAVLEGEFIDNVDGGAGTDTLDLSDIDGLGQFGFTSGPVNINLAAGTWTEVPPFPGTQTITGIERIIGTQLGDTITSANGADRINFVDGQGGNDTIVGDDFTDTLLGGSGNDVLQGGFNNDIINGGLGNDTIVVLEGEFIDDVDGGAHTDTLDLSDMDGTGGPGGTSGAAIVNLAAGTWDLTSGSGGARTITGVEIVRGTQLGDSLTGGAAVDTFYGNGGDDTFSGGAGADKLYGGLGNDTYFREAGDVINELAGEGTDLVVSALSYTLGANLENLTLTGAGNISGTGNTGVNTIIGNTGNNLIKIRDAGVVDTALGGLGNDIYEVDVGDILIENIGEGTDTVRAVQSYTLGANLENLELGGVGNTSGTGNDLANRLTGNTGNNTLTGGLGRDVLVGDTGNDRFDFNALAESGTTAATRDSISDFDAGTSATTVDRLDFSTIDANDLVAGNQTFIFGGAFTAGHIRFVQSGANTLVELNTDGDASAEMSVQLTGVLATNINAADIFL
jgi:serralysin